VRDLPEELEDRAVVAALADGWGVDAAELEYAPVGGGSYHWTVRAADGTRAFATADDLDRKAWLGDTRAQVFENLRRAFDTAAALKDAGLDFVVAPVPSRNDETVRQIDERYTLALFPYLDGETGEFGKYTTERSDILAMLAELHHATPSVESVARRAELDLPGRRGLETALRDLDQQWSGGPFSEPARAALAAGASHVRELIELADGLLAEVRARDADWVVTHGEPHAANVMRTAHGYVLIDWDTVALAPPERDLWMLAGGEAELAAYTSTTGHEPDEAAQRLFRLAWDLGDLAEYVNALRGSHGETADARAALSAIERCGRIERPAG
jgi:spectinomycin phosphotransferase